MNSVKRFWLLIVLSLCGCIPITPIIPTSLPTVVIPTVTFTNTPSPTSISSPTPSITPLPALSQDAASQKIFEYLQTNGNCDLPCFWGITPGQTNVTEAKGLFRELGAVWYDDDSGYLSVAIPDEDGFYLFIRFGGFNFYSKEESDLLKNWHISILLRPTSDDRFGYIHDSKLLTELATIYSLPQVLSKQGRPSEVYMFAYQFVPLGDPNDFYLSLLYKDKGFSVNYDGEAFHEVASPKDKMQGCIASAYVWFDLWDITNTTAAQRIIKSVQDHQFWKTYENATDLNMEDFYSTYKNATDSQCIESLFDIWPTP